MNNADPESQSLIAQLLLLVVLTFINAFLAAAEIVFQSGIPVVMARSEERL